jgi:hypothetical protein
LSVAAARIERRRDGNVITLSRFCHGTEQQKASG